MTRARDAGVQHFVPKPFSAEILLSTLHAALQPLRQKEGQVLLILVADDEPMVLQLAQRALKSASYEVYTACDGHQTLKLLDEFGGRAALFISDQNMPGPSGDELIARTRQRFPQMRFILTSGERDPDWHLQEELGAQLVVLTKPFSLSDLKQTAARLPEADERSGGEVSRPGGLS